MAFDKYKIPGFWVWYWWARWWGRFWCGVRWAWCNTSAEKLVILAIEAYEHSWFENDTAFRLLYLDPAGTMWSRAQGRKKPDVPTTRTTYRRRWWRWYKPQPRNRLHIDGLGGMSWVQSAYDPEVFECEHATNEEEQRSHGMLKPKPQS
jgi:hypothetical protein